MFNDFEPWQWELAFVASRFELGLLNDDEIIAFTHKLMDNGFYDDVMLDIIETDSVYRIVGIRENFEKALCYFHLENLTISQAKYILTFFRLNNFCIRPFNFSEFYKEPFLTSFYGCFYDIFKDHLDNKLFVDIEELYAVIYSLDFELELFAENRITIEIVNKSILEFFEICENWLNRNQTKILEIMHQNFPQT